MATTLPLENRAAIEVVGMNYRYVAAWNEVNGRIALRQHAVALFVTLSAAIITILLGQAREGSPINPNYLSGLMPCISIMLALLNYKHDKTIALLRNFLQEAEEWHTELYDLRLLGYNSDKLYRVEADEIRKLHDYTCAFLIFLFNGIAGYVAYSVLPESSRASGVLLSIYAVLVVACVIGVMRSTWFPHVFPRKDA